MEGKNIEISMYNAAPILGAVRSFTLWLRIRKMPGAKRLATTLKPQTTISGTIKQR